MHSLAIPAQKLLSQTGIYSRRDLKRLRALLHFDDGISVRLRERVTLTTTPRTFTFRKQRFEARLSLPPVLLLNKPKGVITARRDASHSTVFEFLPQPFAGMKELHPVGRLDLDTTGALLFSTDGLLSQGLTHPKKQIPRAYIALIAGAPDPAALETLRRGELALRDGHVPNPLEVSRASEEAALDAFGADLDGEVWSITLTEGKYHEVKRIFAALGAKVERLSRVSYAEIGLDATPTHSALVPSTARRLDEAEVQTLRERVGLSMVRSWIDVQYLGDVEEVEEAEEE